MLRVIVAVAAVVVQKPTAKLIPLGLAAGLVTSCPALPIESIPAYWVGEYSSMSNFMCRKHSLLQNARDIHGCGEPVTETTSNWCSSGSSSVGGCSLRRRLWRPEDFFVQVIVSMPTDVLRSWKWRFHPQRSPGAPCPTAGPLGLLLPLLLLSLGSPLASPSLP